MTKMEAQDSSGDVVRDGDLIRFSYGIPPVGVEARVVERNGKLIALTPNHKPKECTLKQLRKYVHDFYKVAPKRAPAADEVEARMFADRRASLGVKP